MNDLLDLDFSAPVAQPNPHQGRSAFDYLARSTQAPSRPPPAPLPSSARPQIPTARPAPTAPSRNGDAFDDLFNSSKPRASTSESKPMAARLGNGNGLQPSGGRLTPSVIPNQRAPSPSFSATKSVNTWDFDLLASSPSRPSPTTAPSPPLPSSRLPSHTPPFDSVNNDNDAFDDFGLNSKPIIRLGRAQREYDESASDDILGLLSQPVPSHPLPRSSNSYSSSSSNPPPTQRARPAPSPRSASPPPHILGRIVEMGFSLEQASVALAASLGSSGEWNVEAALELLVEQSGGAGERENRHRREEEELFRERNSEREVVPPKPVGRRAREAAALAASNPTSSTTNGAGTESATKVYQEQATVLLSHASKLGLNVFKSASAYYQTGRATIQKALDEGLGDQVDGGARRSQGTNGNGADEARGKRTEEPRKGRPKWMTEDVKDDEEQGENFSAPSRENGNGRPTTEKEAPSLIFQDSDNEEDRIEDPVMPQRPSEQNRSSGSSRKPDPMPQRTSSPQIDARSSTFPSTSSLPTSRRPTPSSSPAPTLLASRPSPSAPTRTLQRPPPSTRVAVPASSLQLSRSLAHKTKGNDLFKLGHFGESISHYTYALDALPEGYLGRIALLNNRASARLKVGEEKAAVEDADLVVRIALGSTSTSSIEFGRVEEDPTGATKVKEGLAKALARRAKGLEAEEKWEQAGRDWSALMEGGGEACRNAGGVKVVSEGVGRCRKMIGGGAKTTATTSTARPSTPVVKSKPSPSASAPIAVVGSGEALTRLRASDALSATEDSLRFSLSDSINATILAWKGGKESNLRALLASLETVLWPELNWGKVGLHEIITEGQLKVKYMKAIGKVHPDKLGPATSVEHRMIAGLVFSALNDAWTASR